MSGIFDRLQKKLDDVQKREEGISAIDIADLPPNLRKIMRLMLRKVEMLYSDLCVAVENMPGDTVLSREELDRALETLTKQGWLIRRGEGERVNYQVNLRRKRGSTLAQGIWSALDVKIDEAKEASKKAAEEDAASDQDVDE